MQVNMLAPGARVVIRDAEWLVRRVDRSSNGGLSLKVVGVSEIVRDKEAVFLTDIEASYEVLEPSQTALVPDTSSGFQDSLLYIESLIRQTPPTDEHIYTGHLAAMDPVPYQLDPAIQALRKPRQRILIADAVGLGKTLEAGILLCELIRRGRGKRVLVVTVKSMLTQFQKEFWSRFTIPLVRLDSVGLQRIRSRIPTNHNPFFYYDRAIISVDTLKNDAEYRTYLENAYWDVIIIDEAHNVAERGTGRSSLRSRLAKLLSHRSDALILLSATPHDGKPKSFASLMNMLDPTAIADPENYTRDDIKGLFIRRFKKDIQDQVRLAFQERKIKKVKCPSSSAEENAFAALAGSRFSRMDQKKSGGELFRTTLEKSLFSSPAACLSTIRNRIARLERTDDPAYADDIQVLRELEGVVSGILPESFSRYQRLIQLCRNEQDEFRWTGKDPSDRLVVFTERIETLNFLKDHLRVDLGLKEKEVAILHGAMSDVDQQRVVEEFGRDDSPVQLLIASDVASEGINLHFLSHRLIHFDIPWSLMVFQQRNGRIDRYGQDRVPLIAYMVTESENPKIRGDVRILELLIEKDEQAMKNIGDPSALLGAYDSEEQERIVSEAIEQGKSVEEFESALAAEFDILSILMEGADGTSKAGSSSDEGTNQVVRSMPSLFADDYSYLETALSTLRRKEMLQVAFSPDERRVELTAPETLKRRFASLPGEVMPEDGIFDLSADKTLIEREIRASRKDEGAWPRVQYLWGLHPIFEWVNDKALSAFRRHEAPVLHLPEALTKGESVFVMSGLIPNRRGQPLIHRWFAVVLEKGAYRRIEPFEEFLTRTGLGRQAYPNRGTPIDTTALSALLPGVVAKARTWMAAEREAFERQINPKLDEQINSLDQLRKKHTSNVQLRLAGLNIAESLLESRRERQFREISKLFDEYLKWIEDTLTTENAPYLQVIAVFKGND